MVFIHFMRLLSFKRYLSRARVFKVRSKAQAFIVSYPKCGRTWLRMLIGRYLCQQFIVDSELALETLHVTRQAGLLPTTFTHDGSEMHKGVLWHPVVLEKMPYREKRVVLLVRDPRDVMVSCFFQATKRDMIYDGSLSEFIRSPQHGAWSYIEFLKAWDRNRAIPREFMVMRYEDMHANPEGHLNCVLSFLGCTQVNSAAIQEAVSYACFTNMQKLEASGQHPSRLTPGTLNDMESFKVRRGKVGGYRDYLNTEDCAFLDQIILDADCSLLKPFCR